ncbi:stage III sporulation protein AE [Caldicoprobacter algeriensis]|uniref:stage III sporulation protein AE n=1 Tax=Caldicoprobacter algeriensis TaxID=699281 RepID=UPI00207931A5|nr:stage III sporulation protein AE [Caldicoprobacter algeriensis]MCM8900898.1 stage III sporulation protein AE [Caldicoprobacter algeriensis]
MKACCIFLLFLLCLPVTAFAQPDTYIGSEDIREQMQLAIDRQLEGLNVERWDEFIKKIQQQGNPAFQEGNARDLIKKILTGEFSLNLKDFWVHITSIFYREVMANLGLMAKIIALAVVCGVLKNMQDSFQSVSAAEVAYFVCYMVVMLLVIHSIMSALEIGRRAVDAMALFTQSFFPVLLALLVSVGGITSSALLNPTIGLLVGFMGMVLEHVMFPLILASVVVIMINHISDKVQLNRLSSLLKNVCEWALGIIFTVFVGAMTVQGVMAASIDGISIRTAKFAVDTFVPVVGKMFAQAVDMVVGCSLLIKNAVGLMGLLVIASICLYPVLKILCVMAIYKLASAVLEPVTDKRIADCLNDIGNMMIIIAITVAGMAIVFFLVITLVIGIGNAATMMR